MEKSSASTTVPSMFQRRTLAVTEILLCSGIPSQVLIASLLAASGMAVETTPGQPALPFVFWLSMIDTLAVVGLMVLLTRARRERLSDLWLGGRPLLREALVGIWLVPLVFVVAAVLMVGLRALA